MASARPPQGHAALDHAQHLLRRRVTDWADHCGEVLDVAKRALQGDSGAEDWFPDLLTLCANAVDLCRFTELDFGLIFDCGVSAEAVGPRYVRIPKELSGRKRLPITVVLRGTDRAVRVNAMVRKEDDELSVALVNLKADKLPAGRYRGTIRYAGHEFACSMIRRAGQ